MSNNNSASNNLRGFLGQIWGGISFVIGVVTSLLGWIQVAQGNLGLFTLILLGVGISALFLACVYYVWFWKPESEDRSREILILDSGEAIKIQQDKQKHRKKVRLLARLGLFIIPILTVAGIAGWQYYISLPTQDFIILVANFEASESQDDLVTPVIFQSLEREMTDYGDDVKVEKLGKSITSIEAAKQEGKLKKAAIVIWGEYQRLDKIFPVSVNFEILQPTSKFPQLGESVKGKFQPFAIAELNSFELQTRLSQEMTYLSFFTLGIYRYLEGDWDRAIALFNKALGTLELRQELVAALGREIVYFYKGSSYLQKYSLQTIDDYYIFIDHLMFPIESIFHSPNSSSYPSKYQRGKDDLNRVINSSSYLSKKEYQQVIEDFNQALKINSQLAMAYNNRGLAYALQRDYHQAINDFNRALKINPQLPMAYSNRGLAYLSQGDYQQAIGDFNRALKINPQRAMTYTEILHLSRN